VLDLLLALELLHAILQWEFERHIQIREDEAFVINVFQLLGDPLSSSAVVMLFERPLIWHYDIDKDAPNIFPSISLSIG
jgi:hypothetical protein